MMDDHVLTGARVFTGIRIVEADIVIRSGRIDRLLAPGSLVAAGLKEWKLGADMMVAPGFIDTQVNGGGGVLFNETPTEEAALAIAAAHRRFGTTALLPTFITGPRTAMQAAALAASKAASHTDSGVIGIHLEGPFLSSEKRGVHKAGFIRRLDGADMDFLTALPKRFHHDHRVVLSLAPERVDLTDITALTKAGLILSGAHSVASYERTLAALDAGLRGFTHLYNAMPAPMGREPGIVGAALLDPTSWCGIIVDGIHVHPAMMRLALAAKPQGKMMLVTDAMSPTGTDVTSFPLYGQTIHRRDGRLVTDDGTLAGADIDMAQAVRNAISLLGLEKEEALRMASLYPAQFLGLDDRLGLIAPQYRADMVLLDERMRVTGTWVAGQWQAADR